MVVIESQELPVAMPEHIHELVAVHPNVTFVWRGDTIVLRGEVQDLVMAIWDGWDSERSGSASISKHLGLSKRETECILAEMAKKERQDAKK